MTIACLRIEERPAWEAGAGAVRRAVRRTAACTPGGRLDVYAGGGKAFRLLCEARCLAVLPVCVFSTRMVLDGCDLEPFRLGQGRMRVTDNDFAREAGFSAFTDLADWLKRTYGLPTHMAPFEGFAIEWREGVNPLGSPISSMEDMK